MKARKKKFHKNVLIDLALQLNKSLLDYSFVISHIHQALNLKDLEKNLPCDPKLAVSCAYAGRYAQPTPGALKVSSALSRFGLIQSLAAHEKPNDSPAEKKTKNGELQPLKFPA